MHNHHNRLQLPERALAQPSSSSFSPPSSVSVYFSPPSSVSVHFSPPSSVSVNFSPPSSVSVFSHEASGNMNLATHFLCSLLLVRPECCRSDPIEVMLMLCARALVILVIHFESVRRYDANAERARGQVLI